MSISRGIYSEDLSQTWRNKNRHLKKEKRKKKNSNKHSRLWRSYKRSPLLQGA